MRIGAHVSTFGSYSKMCTYVSETGCETFAMFAKSPRQWEAKPLDPAKAAQLRTLVAGKSYQVFYTHAAYLINLSTVDDTLRHKSAAALADELVRGALLGAAAVNVHTGNDVDHNNAAAAQRAADAIAYARDVAAQTLEQTAASGKLAPYAAFGDAVPAVPRLLLENTAGAGSSFGATIEQLALTLETAGLSCAELGICIDTCHAWEEGYDVATSQGWSALLALIKQQMGLERLGLLHANDSVYGRGNHKDRHAQIGDGTIGLAGFKIMMEEPLLQDVDVILEIPGDTFVKDEVNVARLKAFRAE